MCKVGLGETGNTSLMERGRTQGGGNVLQGSGPINITVCFGDMGTFGGNGEEGRGSTQRIYHTDHEESSAADRRREVGDTRCRSIVGSGRNAVGDNLYMDTAGNRGTVGGVTTDIQSVCREEGLQRGGCRREAWWRQEAIYKQLRTILVGV